MEKKKYRPDVMEACREMENINEDEKGDKFIMEVLSKGEVFDNVLRYNGIIGYKDTILDLIENIYGIDLNEVE